MNCRRLEPLLSKHVDGSLSAREAERVAAHLRDCPACRRLRDQFQAIGARLREPVHPLLAPDVDHRAIERWMAERAPIGRRRLLSWPSPPLSMRPALWGAAAVVVLATALSVARWEHGSSGGSPTPIASGVSPDSLRQPPSESTEKSLSRKREIGENAKSGRYDQEARKPGDRNSWLPGFLIDHPFRPVRAFAFSRFRGKDFSAPFPRFRVRRAGATAAPDDLAIVNGDPNEAMRQWVTLRHDEWDRVEARVRREVQVRDDFVRIPFPRLASTSERQIAHAVESYKREAAIVDPRLAREVSCALKATALSDLCEQLKAETGIQLTAGPSVADEKVTVFVKDQPLRELMRQVTHAFGYTWLRSQQGLGVGSWELGKDNSGRTPTPNSQPPTPTYRYELVQDLRSQLLEEELRNRDRHAAMLALDAQMAAYQPYLNLSVDEVKARLARATGPEKDLLEKLRYNWGAVQVYHRLTPAQHLALLNGEQPNGEQMKFSIDAPDPDRRLPPEWRQGLLESSFLTFFNLPPGIAGRPTGQYPGETPVAQLPGAMPTVSLRIDRSELGQLALKVGSGVYFGADPTADAGMGLVNPLAVGQNPSATKPDNAAANQELRSQPLFQRIVSVRPEPSCPRFAAKAKQSDAEKGSSFAPRNSLGQFGPEPPHVSSADVWEAVHRATGLNILADSYSHYYPVAPVTVERRPLFEGLCQVADALGVRWKKEGDFLVCRSASFFWDKQKEVPNRWLSRWQQDSRQHHGLPLEDLVEMAALSDQQLDSATAGKVIEHCWGLDEWWLVGNGAFQAGVPSGGLRAAARFLSGLTPAQRRQAQSPGWLAFAELTPAQQQALAALLWPPERMKLSPQSLRFQWVYAPAGTYVWETVVTPDRVQEAWKWPMIVGETREAALAAARRLYPPAAPGEVAPSRGVLWLGLTQADGQSWGIGREPPMVPVRAE